MNVTTWPWRPMRSNRPSRPAGRPSTRGWDLDLQFGRRRLRRIRARPRTTPVRRRRLDGDRVGIDVCRRRAGEEQRSGGGGDAGDERRCVEAWIACSVFIRQERSRSDGRGSLGFGPRSFGEVGTVAGVEHRPGRAHQPGRGRRGRTVLDGRCAASPPWAPTPGTRIGRSRRDRPHVGQLARVGGADDEAAVTELRPLRRRPCRRRARTAAGRPRSAIWKSSPPGLLVRHRRRSRPPPWSKYGSTESVPRYGLTVTAWAP